MPFSQDGGQPACVTAYFGLLERKDCHLSIKVCQFFSNPVLWQVSY
jgi:hypothetical protein